MKFTLFSAALLAGALAILGGLAGCASSHSQAAVPEPQLTDMGIVDSINDSGIRAAIITQHTLYGYHFAGDSRELNELGQRDLAVLISHFKGQGGGDLSIRRGEISESLYASRVEKIKEAIKAAGVDLAAVRIADVSPGGAGMAGDDVVRAVKQSTSNQPAPAAPSGAGDKGASGSGSKGGGQ